MICETSPYPAGTDNIVQTASGSALVNLVDAEGTPIGSVKQGVSLPRDSFAGSALNFPVRMCPPNGTFVRISQPFSGNAIKGPNKCRSAAHRQLIRFSARGSARRILMRFGGMRPGAARVDQTR